MHSGSEPGILGSAAVLLLTGATGRVGSALLTILTMRGEPVRCLVRDPRRLGPARVRVQIALGDLADPASFRHALRGVSTVVHLAGAWRDQPAAGIEELNGLATWRLLRAAERAGVERFMFLSPLGAAPQHPLRVHRAKALAEAAVADSPLATTIFRSSLIHGPGDRHVPLLAGTGDARVQPIAAVDVAGCLIAALDRPQEGARAYELAGPHELSWRAFAALAGGRRALRVPPRLLRPALARLRGAGRAGGAAHVGRGGALHRRAHHAARDRRRRGARRRPAAARH